MSSRRKHDSHTLLVHYEFKKFHSSCFKMDEDMEVKEIRFSQTLSSNLPKTRRRALTKLHEYIQTTSKSKGNLVTLIILSKLIVGLGFTPENLDRLTRGLHYAMWMQDKMLQQEELSDEYGSLIGLFCTEDEINEYMRSMLRTLSKHWGNIDYLRTDKFLMVSYSNKCFI